MSHETTAMPNERYRPLDLPLRGRETEVREDYEGTDGTHGIKLLLDPHTGEIRRADFEDLRGEKPTVYYSPRRRARWAGVGGHLEPSSDRYQLLEAIAADSQALWRDRFRLLRAPVEPLIHWRASEFRKRLEERKLALEHTRPIGTGHPRKRRETLSVEQAREKFSASPRILERVYQPASGPKKQPPSTRSRETAADIAAAIRKAGIEGPVDTTALLKKLRR